MAVKKRTKREKRYMTSEEIRLRKMMLDHEVEQMAIAKHLDVAESAVTYYLRSLTPSRVKQLEDIILELSKTPQKAAS